MIRINCSGCGGILTIPVNLAGTEAKCPGCKTLFQVPEVSADEQADTPNNEAENEDPTSFDPMDVLTESAPIPRVPDAALSELPPSRTEVSQPRKSVTDTGTAAAAVNAMTAINRGPVPVTTAAAAPEAATAQQFNLKEALSSPDNFFEALTENKLYVALAACLLAAFVFYMPKGCDNSIPRFPVSGRVVFADGTPVKTGVVEFESVEHTLSATGRINDDGTFVCPEGMPAGASRAIVTQMVISDGTIKHEKDHGKPVGYRYRQYETSGLKFDILESDDGTKLEVVVNEEVEQSSEFYGVE